MNSIKSTAILVQATIIALSIVTSLPGCGESSSEHKSNETECPAGQTVCSGACCDAGPDDCSGGACLTQPQDCGKNETQCGDSCCNDDTHECDKGVCKPIKPLCTAGEVNLSNSCKACAADNAQWIPRIGAACSEDGGSICDGLGKCAKWKSVATGVRHTCGVTESGTAMCWGDNSYGQLGNGKGGEYGTKSQVPQAVVGLETGVVAISAGGGHSCAVTSAGSVECWGQHIFMQFFGEETISNMNAVPAQVLGPESGAVAVSSGHGHACALTSAGGAMCWGWNFFGQLGDGTRIDNEIPQPVLGIESGVVAIAGGGQSSCAIS
ncbi:MAG: hypothetical protein FWD57_16740, partial [Polyangiaceae bacterium]|nr:hypothetical protein [Polyangiaceae bacterium]